ncbi:MAG: Rrf2 family transcriptional regulator [Planctomycetes bacterium]|nr:Rrf2 family transcriptional regulator [Planctomycetota bacterium]
MQLTLHTDYALRVLIFLARIGRRERVEAIADAFGVSKDHLVKVVQTLARLGYVQTHSGRGGGVSLAREAASIDVAEVVGELEGRQQLLACFDDAEACLLEPGCRLRKRLMLAEKAFFDALAGLTVADLVSRPDPRHGISRLPT